MSLSVSQSLQAISACILLAACSAAQTDSPENSESTQNAANTCAPGLECSPAPENFDDDEPLTTGSEGSLTINADNLPTGAEPRDTTDEPCAEAEVVFEQLIPEVHVVIDRSGSMKGFPIWDPYNSEAPVDQSRWGILGQALFGDGLMSVEKGIVGSFHETVAFGARFYSVSSFTEELKLNNYTALRDAYDGTVPGGQTYTAAALSATTTEAVLMRAGTAAVEKAVADAYALGIKTYAIFIGDSDANEQHLQNIANLGLGLAIDGSAEAADYYTTSSQAGLYDAFSNIVVDARSCFMAVDGQIDQERVNEGEVILTGKALAFDDPNGWRMAGPNTVELLGSSCEALNLGTQTLNIEFSCEIYTPPVLR